ncbi:MAG: Na+/H+ antiporter NhaC family protein [Oscillibacter sp.]|nr:Na+/H+ antiporter NhaC family protein [Oscillibacter sp.]
MSNNLNQKKNGWSLLPFLIFIVIYLGAGLYLQAQGTEMAFYQFPSVTAMFIAVIVAFCFGKETLDQKFTIFARGAANENVLTMLMIYILAGAFSTVAKTMGGVDATVNLGLSIIPVQLLLGGVFVISAFLGTATGTSVGTITALVPIAVGLATESGLSVPMMLGACAGGAMFGDNLSMISDTTIAATKTQGVAMRDKFRVNFYIALPAAVITLIVLLVAGRPDAAAVMGEHTFEIIKVLPYVLVLALAIIGVNVFLTLTIGIFAAGIIGMVCGDLTIFAYAQAIWNGFTGMSEVFFLALFCGGISELIAHNGGIAWLIEKLRKTMRGSKSAQVGVSALVSLADCATANNTVAIILCGNVAKDISREYKVDPRRTASLLDVFSCVFQGIIPYGAQLLMAASLTTTTYNIAISPVEIVPYMWYCWVLAAFGLLSIFVPYADGVCRKDPWNWEYDVAESGVAEKKAQQEQV